MRLVPDSINYFSCSQRSKVASTYYYIIILRYMARYKVRNKKYFVIAIRSTKIASIANSQVRFWTCNGLFDRAFWSFA